VDQHISGDDGVDWPVATLIFFKTERERERERERRERGKEKRKKRKKKKKNKKRARGGLQMGQDPRAKPIHAKQNRGLCPMKTLLTHTNKKKKKEEINEHERREERASKKKTRKYDTKVALRTSCVVCMLLNNGGLCMSASCFLCVLFISCLVSCVLAVPPRRRRGNGDGGKTSGRRRGLRWRWRFSRIRSA